MNCGEGLPWRASDRKTMFCFLSLFCVRVTMVHRVRLARWETKENADPEVMPETSVSRDLQENQ